MAEIIPRIGTSPQNDLYIGRGGEIVIDSDIQSLRVHDGLTAGGFVPGNTFQQIGTYTLSSPANTYTFSNIGGYSKYKIFVNGNCSATNYLYAYPNGLTTTFYSSELFNGSASAGTRPFMVGYCDVATGSMSYETTIYNQSGPTRRSVAIGITERAEGNIYTGHLVCIWTNNSTAITSFQIQTSSGNMSTGFKIDLYGQK